MNVVFMPKVEDYLFELTEILFHKEYFGFKETAIQYVNDLISDITVSLHHKQKKNAPVYFSKYGTNMYYSVFKKNKNTQWYIFFNIYRKSENPIYLVRFISNNHVIAQYL